MPVSVARPRLASSRKLWGAPSLLAANAIPALLDRIYATGTVEDARGEPMDAFPHGVPRRHADELTRLVLEEGAERTLETGMAVGVSTLAICRPHAERGHGSHVAIDPAQSGLWRSAGTAMVERAGLGGIVRVLEERAETALPRLSAEGQVLDFALIDGKHLFDFALLDFFYIDRMLRVGGHVAFHDTWLPAIDHAVAYVLANRRYARSPRGDADMAVLRKLGEDDRRMPFHRSFRPRPGWRRRVEGVRARHARTPAGRNA